MSFKRCSIGTKGPKVCQENILKPLHHHHQPEPLRQGRMDPCFHVLYAKFWPDHLNVAAEVETHQTRQRFSNLLLSNFGDPVWIVPSVSCSYLTGAAPGVVFCCWSPSASVFDVLCVQRCILHTLVVTSGYLSYCCLFIISIQSAHSPLTSDINKVISVYTTAARWIFSLFSDHSL